MIMVRGGRSVVGGGGTLTIFYLCQKNMSEGNSRIINYLSNQPGAGGGGYSHSSF